MSIKNINKKILILSALVLAGLIFAGYTYYQNKNNEAETETTSDTDDFIDYSPATEQDIKEVDKHKADLPSADEFNNTNNTSSSNKKSVVPEITSYGVYGGNVEVASRVPGIFENSGECTLALKKNSKSISQTKAATPNVSEMSCGLIKIAKSRLSKGAWQATIIYNSNKAFGSSTSVSVEVK